MCEPPVGNPTPAPTGRTQPSLGTKTNTAAGMMGLAVAGWTKRLFWVDPVLIFVEVGGQR